MALYLLMTVVVFIAGIVYIDHRCFEEQSGSMNDKRHEHYTFKL